MEKFTKSEFEEHFSIKSKWCDLKDEYGDLVPPYSLYLEAEYGSYLIGDYPYNR